MPSSAELTTSLTAPLTLARFTAPLRPIGVAAPDAVLTALSLFLTVKPTRSILNAAVVPDIAVNEAEGRFTLSGPGQPDLPPVQGAVAAAHLLADRLSRAYALQPEDAMLLHAGAVEVDGGLALLIGDSEAGKSTTTLHAAAFGHRIFGDDRLMVRPLAEGGAGGIALGLRPKLRLPLPADVAPELRRLSGQTRFETPDGVAVIDLPAARLAAQGSSAPLSALYILARDRDAGVEIAPLTHAERVRELLRHSAVPAARKAAHLDRIAALSERLPMLRLHFARSADAARAVIEAQSGWAEAAEA